MYGKEPLLTDPKNTISPTIYQTVKATTGGKNSPPPVVALTNCLEPSVTQNSHKMRFSSVCYYVIDTAFLSFTAYKERGRSTKYQPIVVFKLAE